MVLRWSLRPNAYYDSVRLMQISEALSREPGVQGAAAVMATPLNLELLAADGLLPPDLAAKPDDLIVALRVEGEETGDALLARLDELLASRQSAGEETTGQGLPARTLEEGAVRAGGNMAVIAVPGQFAAAEAYAALRAGLHVFLFSDNVSLDDEVRLKEIAAGADLLMMGPDCGTAIVDGVGLGFANRVSPGPVGIVGASGTGIQQLCCLLDAAGVGIAQAVGTGGRDLSARVGGSMTRRAIWMLEALPEVEIIAVISKPADAGITLRLHQELVSVGKPVVVCLLGETPPDAEQIRYAPTIADAARTILEMLGAGGWTEQPLPEDKAGAGTTVYGLFAGGTLCSEAGRVLTAMAVRHSLVDVGADEYTRGRAHPIIDPRLRAAMLADLAQGEEVGAVLLDIILGDLAHPDPAATLLPAIEGARAGTDAPVVATLIGTRRDPQDLERQRAALEEAGVLVYASNARAARAAGILAGGKV